jgi:hypothetical protein
MLTTSIQNFVSKRYEAVSGAMHPGTGLNLRGSRARIHASRRGRIVPEKLPFSMLQAKSSC